MAASKAGRFADAAEAAGWLVERHRDAAGGRQVVARRGGEAYSLQWIASDSVATGLKFDQGWHRLEGREVDEPANNVAAVLRAMTEPEHTVKKATNGKTVRLPFDPIESPDKDVLDAVRGMRISWINSITGLEESGHVPPFLIGGANPIHVEGKLTEIKNVYRRILFFASEEGLRAVALDSIVKVWK